jgi:hypothetical protein
LLATVALVFGLLTVAVFVKPGVSPAAQPAAHPWGSSIAMAQNADGRLEVFGTNDDDVLFHMQQPSQGGWTGAPWLLLDEGRMRAVAAQTNLNGLVEVFGVDAAGEIFHRVQSSPGAWISYMAPFDGSLTSIAAARGADGRLELFGTNSDDAVVWMRQSSPGKWTGSSWQVFDGRLTQVAAQTNQDGRVELFGVNAAGAIVHRVQPSAGTWDGSTWLQFGGSLISIAAARDADGRLELFGTNSAGAVVRMQQAGPGSWTGSSWQVFDGRLTQVAAQTGQNGFIDLWGVNPDGVVFHRQQSSPGNWDNTSWTRMGGRLRGIPDPPVLTPTPGHPADYILNFRNQGDYCVVPERTDNFVVQMRIMAHTVCDSVYHPPTWMESKIEFSDHGPGSCMCTINVTRFQDIQTGLCLAVGALTAVNGTPVVLADCALAASWWIEQSVPNRDGYNLASATNQSECVEVPNASRASGIRLGMWTCKNTPEQVWNPLPF